MKALARILVLFFFAVCLPSSFAAVSLKITSTPANARILLHGEEQKNDTPHTLKNLEDDKKYKVKLKKEGYKDFETQVKSKCGTLHIHADLHKEAKDKASPSDGSAVERTFGYNKIYKEGTYGWLEVSTTPSGAVVYVDDKRQVGPTPNQYKLPIGRVKVSVVIKGKAVREFPSVNISAGKVTKLAPIDFRDEVGRPNTEPLLKGD